MNSSERKLLAVGDFPDAPTGFAKVTRNLYKRWLPHFSEIHAWSINYNGWPHELPYKCYPAGFSDWTSGKKLTEFLNLLAGGDFTHVFFLADCHNLGSPDFVKYLKQICEEKKIHSTFYYPVDAPMEKHWLECAAACDLAVTYTEYGRKETTRARPGLSPHIIPHGVETDVYYPREDRLSLRQQSFGKWVDEEDFLILNVNRNERRKAPHHSIQLLKRLRDRGVRAKLVMHCPRLAHDEFTDLEQVGEQLGAPHGKHWRHNDDWFVAGNGRVTEEGLNLMYNAADLVLSTSLGEGWGLSLVEGAAAGCPIAAPNHSGCKEVMDGLIDKGQFGQCWRLPVMKEMPIVNPLHNSRVWYPIDIEKSADVIEQISECTTGMGRFVLSDEAREWLSWDRIANEFIKLMGVK
jgi:D-inositol-3-phosphate glycosyltransferase